MTTYTRLEQSVQTACEHGAMCVHDRSGHTLTQMRLALALATPGGWQDGVVVSADVDGWIDVATLDGAALRLWNHADRTAVLAPGEPVAVHANYDVLIAGDVRLNIVR